MTTLRSRRWCGGVGTGKSAALRSEVTAWMHTGARPIAFLPAVSDIGLRTERVSFPDPEIAATLGAQELSGRLARDLSSGERQRVRLALALSHSVGFAALDEPCRHLDPDHVQALDRVLAARTKSGLQLAVCESRQNLSPELFQEELGASSDARCPDVKGGRSGENLTLEIPTPFLLSSEKRPTVKRRIELQAGSIVLVTGPNGSGKTSLLEALARAARDAGLRYGVSRQEPEHQVFGATLEAELAMVSSLHAPPPWGGRALLANLGLDPWRCIPAPRLPLGVLCLTGAAIALGMGSELVLLDEPTQGLDVAGARMLAAELLRCADRGARIVVASHDPELLRIATLTWSVRDGELRAEETR